MSALNNNERQELRRSIRKLSGDDTNPSISRIGDIVSFAGNHGDTRRYRFGISLVGIAIFCAALANLMPDKGWEAIFVGFAVLALFVGAWQIDKAKKQP